jgi:hypothetical protein
VKPNVGGTDRRVRAVAGVALVGLAAAVSTLDTGAGPVLAVGLPLVALLVGAELLVTATLRRCPVNAAAGIDTADST